MKTKAYITYEDVIRLLTPYFQQKYPNCNVIFYCESKKKYHDDGSPAIEPIERVKRRFAVENRKYYFIMKDGARDGAINIGHNDPNEKKVAFISPLFVLPEFQNRGIGYVAIQKAFETLPEVTTWKLDTILQEPANCHLYEKCGFVRVGEEKVINENMTLIDYELNL